MQLYRKDKNTGLPTNFTLNSGKFQLVGGTEKCQDNMRMLMYFMGWFRYYHADFCVNIFWFLQKPTSFLTVYKNIFLGQFIDAAMKYAPFIEIKKANIFYDNTGSDRKNLVIGVEYVYAIERDKPYKFVQILQS